MKFIYILQILALTGNSGMRTVASTTAPTARPSSYPSMSPTTPRPTSYPSVSPTPKPSSDPSVSPTTQASSDPSMSPTARPSSFPTTSPTSRPTSFPTISPSVSVKQWKETDRIAVSDAASYDNFGWSVSVSGNIAIASAVNYDDIQGPYSGSVYVFEKDESTGQWREVAKLVASDGRAYDYFGYSLSVSGNTAIIGALYAGDHGSAYVFEKGSTGYWNEVAKLAVSDAASYDNFGNSVSISGNIAIVGAPYDDDRCSSSGSAYVFEKDESTELWREVAKLSAWDGSGYDSFGFSVDISGNTVIIGALYDDDNGVNSGSAYVFEKDESSGYWYDVAKLTSSDGAVFGLQFGHSVSLSGNIAIVGAPHDDDFGSSSGSAYVFEKDQSTGHWHEVAKLLASDGAAYDQFGFSVSVSGNAAIVGACFDDNNGNDSGSTFVFEKDESTGHWNEATKLTASDGVAYENFGCSVSLSGNSAIVGAYYDDYTVYAFEKV